MLFVDDMVLLASLSDDLQLALEWFVAKFEVTEIEITNSKKKKMEKLKVEKFEYVWVLSMSEGRVEHEKRDMHFKVLLKVVEISFLQ